MLAVGQEGEGRRTSGGGPGGSWGRSHSLVWGPLNPERLMNSTPRGKSWPDKKKDKRWMGEMKFACNKICPNSTELKELDKLTASDPYAVWLLFVNPPNEGKGPFWTSEFIKLYLLVETEEGSCVQISIQQPAQGQASFPPSCWTSTALKEWKKIPHFGKAPFKPKWLSTLLPVAGKEKPKSPSVSSLGCSQSHGARSGGAGDGPGSSCAGCKRGARPWNGV